MTAISGLLSLPTETLLQIIRSFTVPEILALQRVSSKFYDLIRDNASTVYRNAAEVHGYVPPIHQKKKRRSSSLAGGKRVAAEDGPTALRLAGKRFYGSYSSKRFDSWLELCKTRWAVDRVWSKPSIPVETVLPPIPSSDSFEAAFLDGRGEELFLTMRDHGGGFFRQRTLSFDPTADMEWQPLRTSSLGAVWGTLVAVGADEEEEEASDEGGFMLFKMAGSVYHVWQHRRPQQKEADDPKDYVDEFFREMKENLERDPFADETGANPGMHKEDEAKEEFRFVGEIRVEGGAYSYALKGDHLIMGKEWQLESLLVFKLSSSSQILPPESSEDGQTPPTRRILQPTFTLHLPTLLLHPSLKGKKAAGLFDSSCTRSIAFNDEHIFFTNARGLYAIDRDTWEVVLCLGVEDVSWRKIRRGRWTKCFTSNVFCLGKDESKEEGATSTKVPFVQDVSAKRKDEGWSWEAQRILLLRDGMVMVCCRGGQIVCLPDYRRLLPCGDDDDDDAGERWRVDDPRAAWVLDLEEYCPWIVSDGRRVAWIKDQTVHILDLDAGTDGRGLQVVRHRLQGPGRGWQAVDAAMRSGSFALTSESLWFFGKRNQGRRHPMHMHNVLLVPNEEQTPVHLVRWDFRAA